MAVIPSTLKEDLFARGTELREPASEEDIVAFELAMDVRLDRSWRELYSLFNGFKQADHRSLIFLWGLDEMAQRNSAERDLRQGRSLAIGDLLIDSDFFVSDLSQEASVSLLFEKSAAAESVIEFVLLLSSGRFDCLAAETA